MAAILMVEGELQREDSGLWPESATQKMVGAAPSVGNII